MRWVSSAPVISTGRSSLEPWWGGAQPPTKRFGGRRVSPWLCPYPSPHCQRVLRTLLRDLVCTEV